jgi:hypothetical protein
MLTKAAGEPAFGATHPLGAHQLAPHRIRSFKLSNDPKFAEKLKDVVGLYVDQPAHPVVPSVDEEAKPSCHDTPPCGFDSQIGK